jgi:hypothetical protein
MASPTMKTPASSAAKILILGMAQPLCFQPFEPEAVFVVGLDYHGSLEEANLTTSNQAENASSAAKNVRTVV